MTTIDFYRFVHPFLGLRLGTSLTFRHHLVALRKKTVTLLRQIVDSGQDAASKMLCTATLSLGYCSTAEYCAPVWCRSAHTRLIDNDLNDALHIVTGYLRPRNTYPYFQASSQLNFAD